jgi:phospholipid transport system substrate-binding protein
MKKTYFLVLTIALFIAWHSPLHAKLYEEGTPTRAIQDLDKLLDTYVVSPKTPEERTHNRQLKKQALDGTFDIRTLARISMAKHWKDLVVKQQDHFVSVLSRLLERKAVFAKEQGGGGKKKQGASYRVTYEGHKTLSNKEKALVKSWVRIPSENLNISLNYKVHEVDRPKDQPRDPILGGRLPVPDDWPTIKGWKIYDVIVDDASLLDNYRYQFDSIIKKGGYEDLIRRMESKLEELKEKEEEKEKEKEKEEAEKSEIGSPKSEG